MTDLTSETLLPASAVLARYSISDMSLWRWLQDEKLAFPRPIVIQRRRYFYAHEIEAWERARAAGRVPA